MVMDREELNLLLESAQRWFSDNNSFGARVTSFREGHRQTPEGWQALAEMGWLALPLTEANGGFDADHAARFALIRLAGEHVRPEALETHLLLAPAVVEVSPDQAEALATGAMRLGVADLPDRNGITADTLDGTCILSGRSGPVLGSQDATHYVVFVRDAAGVLRAALLAANAPGLSCEQARLIDKRDTVLLTLDRTPGLWLDQADDVGAGQRLRDLVAAGQVADAAGVLEVGFNLTLDYLKQRTQFGRPLSQLQAVQHKMADIFCDVKQMTALAERLAQEIDASPKGPWPTLPIAKAFVGRRAIRGMGQLIQLSGGIGVTEEYKITHLYRRLHVAATMFGAAEAQLARIGVRDVLQAA
ncbi:acyl-CoA dehydrogenase family protein [Pollutimonas harenae]|uniref:Acyl-CoA/acyl-ACP dehydrogenase n=1 Tax=Pollutimonas harenae TaxID=657015 RepID=A0A853GQM2_9BURK|nr:acyl-CoA dehydrogenase family protein [Pollutimonas harenae]NYT84441.1 acyl-CoA/acyl-ACP dehydrogenase [Pollutimonas harenae]TEA73158.1 acyl-CoA dehydrogenase [Pollutimonas harenae]